MQQSKHSPDAQAWGRKGFLYGVAVVAIPATVAGALALAGVITGRQAALLSLAPGGALLLASSVGVMGVGALGLIRAYRVDGDTDAEHPGGDV